MGNKLLLSFLAKLFHQKKNLKARNHDHGKRVWNSLAGAALSFFFVVDLQSFKSQSHVSYCSLTIVFTVLAMEGVSDTHNILVTGVCFFFFLFSYTYDTLTYRWRRVHWVARRRVFSQKISRLKCVRFRQIDLLRVTAEFGRSFVAAKFQIC